MHQRGNSQTTLLSREVMAAARAPRPFSDGNIWQGFPSAGFQPYMQPRRHPAHPKQASHFEGFPTRAHVLCPSVTRAAESLMTSPTRFLAQAGVRVMHRGNRFACSANRTCDAGHTELYIHARLENPSDPNSYFQPSFCPSTGSAYIHHVCFWIGFHSRRRARGGLV